MGKKSSLCRFAVFAGIIAVGTLLSLVVSPPRQKRQVRWTSMGTVAAITFRGGAPQSQDAVRERVQGEWLALEKRLTAWDADSELSHLAPRLVADGEKALAEVPADVRPCYSFAFDLRRQSSGAFNPVVGEQLRKIGFTRLSPVDLGAVAKGFAVDRAWELLEEGDMLLDLGGNLRAKGGSWHTGVRNPFSSGAYAATFDLRDGEAVATSGSYERFVERDGKRFSHILDARTGQPVAGIAGVTVLAASAMLADGLSTTLFVLGPDAGIAFLESHYPGTAALWIPDTPENPAILATVPMAARLQSPAFPVTVLRKAGDRGKTSVRPFCH
ncbi:MAG: FAD:protein FMN transferase [Kiritimatiellae bacterium]|nr:FAD:protein FMN transferase [Kiritimatiellia bacterium]